MRRGVRIVAIDFKRLEQLLLVALYDRYVNSDVEYASIRTLGQIVGYSGLNPIRDVLLELEKADLIRQGSRRVLAPSRSSFLSLGMGQADYVEEPSETFRLTKKGVLQVASFDQRLVDQLSNQLVLDDEPVPERSSTDRTKDVDRWEPLELDRAAPEFLQAVQATEEAIQRIEGDNGYATTEPDERNGIVASMRGALNAMKTGLVSREFIQAGLINTLKFVVEKFSGAGIAEFGKRAIDFLIKLIS